MLAMLWESGRRAAPSSMPPAKPHADEVGDPRREFHPCQIYLIIQSLYLLGQCSVQSLPLSLPPAPGPPLQYPCSFLLAQEPKRVLLPACYLGAELLPCWLACLACTRLSYPGLPCSKRRTTLRG